MDEIYCDDKTYPNIEEIKKDFEKKRRIIKMCGKKY